MRSLRKFGFVFVGLSFLLLASCFDSKAPLSDPEKAEPAKELIGVWKAEDVDGVAYYHVGKAGEGFPPGLMHVMTVKHKKNGELPVASDSEDLEEFFFFATTLGDRHFLSVTALEPDQMKQIKQSGWKASLVKGYWIFEYQLQKDKLRLLMMDHEQKKAAIKAGKVKGVIKKGGMWGGDQVCFQDSSENMAKFITSADAKNLFVAMEDIKDGAFTRVK